MLDKDDENLILFNINSIFEQYVFCIQNENFIEEEK